MQNMFAYNEKRDLHASINYFHQALSVEPNRGDLRSNLGWRYTELGRLEDALQYYEEAYRTDPLGVDYPSYERFIATYASLGMWKKAEAVIKANIDRFDRNDRWSRTLAILKYYQSGDKSAFVRDLKKMERFTDYPQGRAWLALMARDYPSALKHHSEIEDSQKDFYNYGIREESVMSLRPLRTINALIWFELNDEEKSLVEAKKTKAHLLDVIENADSVDPLFWSNLSIVYALEGNREQMVMSAEKTRALASTEYYKFLEQAECEMHIAIAHLVLGDHDKAIETLEAASKMDSLLLVKRELDLWFIFDRLRGNPRFDALLEDN